MFITNIINSIIYLLLFSIYNYIQILIKIKTQFEILTHLFAHFFTKTIYYY